MTSARDDECERRDLQESLSLSRAELAKVQKELEGALEALFEERRGRESAERLLADLSASLDDRPAAEEARGLADKVLRRLRAASS